MEDFDKLRNFISENRIEKAFESLKKLSQSNSSSQNEVLALAAKFSDTRKKENLGLIDNDEVLKIRSQINIALLEIIDAFENNASAHRDAKIEITGVESSSGRKSVFISYNHHDAETANTLKEKLKTQNIDVLIDSEKMVAGSDIKEFIESCVRDTDTTLSLISKKSLLSAWVAMESINTFYLEKPGSRKKFIACYIDNDFFQRDFTDNALDTIEEEVRKIQEMITKRLEKNRSIRDLQNELTRFTDLRNNMDEIIRRLRESLCIDIHNESLENNFAKILQAINS